MTDHNSPPSVGARLKGLDVIRGIAILLVLLHHAEYPRESLIVIPWIMVPFRLGGWVGVDLFYVLSGFLVSGILFRQYQRECQIRPWNFLARRGFKINPRSGVWWLTVSRSNGS